LNTFIVAADASLAPGSPGVGGAAWFAATDESDPYASSSIGWGAPASSDYSIWVDGHGYNWQVTFLETAHSGNVVEMEGLPGTGWAGTNVEVLVRTETDG